MVGKTLLTFYTTSLRKWSAATVHNVELMLCDNKPGFFMRQINHSSFRVLCRKNFQPAISRRLKGRLLQQLLMVWFLTTVLTRGSQKNTHSSADGTPDAKKCIDHEQQALWYTTRSERSHATPDEQLNLKKKTARGKTKKPKLSTAAVWKWGEGVQKKMGGWAVHHV